MALFLALGWRVQCTHLGCVHYIPNPCPTPSPDSPKRFLLSSLALTLNFCRSLLRCQQIWCQLHHCTSYTYPESTELQTSTGLCQVVGSNLGLAVVASALKQLYLPNKLQQVVGQEPCLFQGSEVASLGEVGLDVPEPGAQALSH